MIGLSENYFHPIECEMYNDPVFFPLPKFNPTRANHSAHGDNCPGQKTTLSQAYPVLTQNELMMMVSNYTSCFSGNDPSPVAVLLARLIQNMVDNVIELAKRQGVRSVSSNEDHEVEN
jgi:hypothetical protein